jgi:small-conductance mechanosensitive channel
MDWLLEHLPEVVGDGRWMQWIRAALLLAFGLWLARRAGQGAAHLAEKRGNPQAADMARRFVSLGISAVILATVLRQLGFDLAPLLGAAGVLSVAVGVASQTAASNVISGLFLLMERPFRVGDSIEAGGASGEVVHVGLLSVGLRTLDHQFVRVPSETLLKGQIVNQSRYPTRRLDLPVGVAYASDAAQVERVLLDAAGAEPAVLKQPAPRVIFRGFGASALDFVLQVWVDSAATLSARSALNTAILKAFQHGGMEFPGPQQLVPPKRDAGS